LLVALAFVVAALFAALADLAIDRAARSRQTEQPSYAAR
jgi:hypothetical protein